MLHTPGFSVRSCARTKEGMTHQLRVPSPRVHIAEDFALFVHSCCAPSPRKGRGGPGHLLIRLAGNRLAGNEGSYIWCKALHCC